MGYLYKSINYFLWREPNIISDEKVCCGDIIDNARNQGAPYHGAPYVGDHGEQYSCLCYCLIQ